MDNPMSEVSKKEREILKVMRQVLASIIKDTTPPHRGMKHPLSDQTIEDVRACLGLISARERELADAVGIPMEKPHYADDVQAAQVVNINRLRKNRKTDEDS
jgi:hypothetical protein